MDQNLQDSLEAFIDRNGLYDVVGALQLVCVGKAEHLESHWQDKDAAKRWDKAAGAFERLEAKLRTIQLP